MDMRREYMGYLNRRHNIGDGKKLSWYLSTSTEHLRGAECR